MKLRKILSSALLTLPLFSTISLSSCNSKKIDKFADKDFDGLPDAIDDKPEDNTVTYRYHNYVSIEDDTSADELYNMDYRYFVDMDPMVYHQEIGKICMPIVTNAYTFTDTQYKDSNGNYISSTIENNFLERIGVWDIEEINLYDETYDKDECDILYGKIGHHDFIYKDQKYQIFIISLRGTVSLREAVSDLDVGIDNTNYTTDRATEHPEWTHPEYHKGFDVTTNRVLEKVKAYVNKHKLEGFNEMYLVGGHSRGASVANLIGKTLQDEGKKNFTYCVSPAPVYFGDPITDGRYDNIINLVSVHDIVPDIRTKDGKFLRYGQDIKGDVDDMREQYKKFLPSWAPDFIDPKILTDYWANNHLLSRESIYEIKDPSTVTSDDDYYVYSTNVSDTMTAEQAKKQTESIRYTVNNRFTSLHPNLAHFAKISDVIEDTDAEGNVTGYHFNVTTSLGFLIEVSHVALTAPFDALDCMQYMMRFFRIGIEFPIIGGTEEGFVFGTLKRMLEIGVRNLILMHLPQTYNVIVDNTPSNK